MFLKHKKKTVFNSAENLRQTMNAHSHNEK